MIAYLRQERTDLSQRKVCNQDMHLPIQSADLGLRAWPYNAVCASRHYFWWKQAPLTPLSCSTFRLSSISQSCQTYLLDIYWVQPLLITATIITSVKFAIISHPAFLFFLTFEFVSPLVGILVPWPGVEPVPSAVKVLNPNYWTTREFSLTQTLGMSPFFLLTPIQSISNIKLSDHLKHNPDLICFAGLSRPPYYTIAHSSPLLLSLLFCLIFLHCPHHH